MSQGTDKQHPGGLKLFDRFVVRHDAETGKSGALREETTSRPLFTRRLGNPQPDAAGAACNQGVLAGSKPS